MQQLFVLSVSAQQIIRRLNWEEERQQKIHLIQIEESDEKIVLRTTQPRRG